MPAHYINIYIPLEYIFILMNLTTSVTTTRKNCPRFVFAFLHAFVIYSSFILKITPMFAISCLCATEKMMYIQISIVSFIGSFLHYQLSLPWTLFAKQNICCVYICRPTNAFQHSAMSLYIYTYFYSINSFSRILNKPSVNKTMNPIKYSNFTVFAFFSPLLS